MNNSDIKETPEIEERVRQINEKLQDWLISGKVVIDQAKNITVTEATGELNNYIISTPCFAELEEKGVGKEGVHGACRIIAPSVAGQLKKDKLIDSYEYCLWEKVWHPAIVAVIENEKFFIDIGLSTPIPVAVPINKEPASTDFYEQFGKGQKQYKCANESDKNLCLSIFSNNKKRVEMIFREMTPKDELPVFTNGFRKAIRLTLKHTSFENGFKIEDSEHNLGKVMSAIAADSDNVRLIYGGENMGPFNKHVINEE